MARGTERDGDRFAAAEACGRSGGDGRGAERSTRKRARYSGEAAADRRAADRRARSGDRDGERDHHSRRSGCVRPDDAGDGRRCDIVRHGSGRRCCAARRWRWCRTRRCREPRGVVPRRRSRRPPRRLQVRHARPVPGGRAGPGGAYAFDDAREPAATTAAIAGGGRGSGTRRPWRRRADAVAAGRGFRSFANRRHSRRSPVARTLWHRARPTCCPGSSGQGSRERRIR